jgi:hypothetical protein
MKIALDGSKGCKQGWRPLITKRALRMEPEHPVHQLMREGECASLDQVAFSKSASRILCAVPQATRADNLLLNSVVRRRMLDDRRAMVGYRAGLLPKALAAQFSDDLAGVAASHAFQPRSNFAVADQERGIAVTMFVVLGKHTPANPLATGTLSPEHTRKCLGTHK